MQKHGILDQHVNPLHILPQHSLHCSGNKSPHVVTEQFSVPAILPEKCSKIRSMRVNRENMIDEDPDKVKVHDHRIDIGDEKSDLLGYAVISGKLVLDNKTTNANADIQSAKESTNQNSFDAKLTRKALVWRTHTLYLDDIISVSYHNGLRHFTVHAYPTQRKPCGLPCLFKPKRCRKDFRFLACSSEEALKWVAGFADLQCYVNCLPHPVSSKRLGSTMITSVFSPEKYIRCKSPPTVLVILNPRSGRGRSGKIFYSKVEPIFKLAGFNMEVINTTSPGHARTLAFTADFNTCPDGIICVGGDGIVNEVLNGLLSRNDQKEAISIPIGIIPAGSDNSLVWTVLGVRDPVSAAIAIVKGGLTAADVFAVEWMQTGVIHFGVTVSYYGFVSDVLELSEKYQKRFGPLRYLVAGVLKFFCLPKYSFEVEYLPVSKAAPEAEVTVPANREPRDSSCFPDTVKKTTTAGMHRASSLSSIDSILTPSRLSEDLDTTSSTLAGNEPSDYVRGIDPKLKRMSSGRNNTVHEPEEVLHPQPHLSAHSNWPRTRSKSRTDKGWAGLISTNDSRGAWGNVAANEKEDISSTVSDPGPIWDAEPKWDTEPKGDTEPYWIPDDAFKLPGLDDDIERGMVKDEVPKQEEKWVVKKGEFLGVLLCNHACKTVQNLNSQVVAPKAEHDDKALDLLLVHGNGRLKLLRFFLLMQFGKHLSLPYVEYVQVKSLRLTPGKNAHCGCGIDGELLPMNGHVVASLLPDQCRLIGRPVQDRV